MLIQSSDISPARNEAPRRAKRDSPQATAGRLENRRFSRGRRPTRPSYLDELVLFEHELI